MSRTPVYLTLAALASCAMFFNFPANAGTPDGLVRARSLVALGGNPSATQSFNLSDLTTTPGKIEIGTNVLTVLEFSDDITQVASGRPDFITSNVSEINKAMLMLRGSKSSGSTDLHVTLASGETAMFVVSINASMSTPKRYIIRGSESQTPPVVNTAGSAAVSGLPEWLGMRADYNAFENGDLVVQYAIQNRDAKSAVIANRSALNFYTLDGTTKLPLEYTLTRQTAAGGTLGMINPGKSEYGVISVKNVASARGVIHMEWQVANQETRAKATYKTEFDLANATSR